MVTWSTTTRRLGTALTIQTAPGPSALGPGASVPHQRDLRGHAEALAVVLAADELLRPPRADGDAQARAAGDQPRSGWLPHARVVLSGRAAGHRREPIGPRWPEYTGRAASTAECLALAFFLWPVSVGSDEE